MKVEILNVHVSNLSIANTRCAVGWETPDGMHWHYWTTLERKTPQVSPTDSGTLYKNCPSHLKSGEPGHFHARQLDPESKLNRAMVREAIRIADEKMLWTAAVAELADKEAQRDRETAAAFAVYLAKEGGPRLLAAAEAFVKWWHTFEGAQMIAEIHHPDVSEFYAAIAASKSEG